jgi:hypothetical protein
MHGNALTVFQAETDSIHFKVLLETKKAGSVLATVLGLPECRTEGANQQQAIANLQALLAERLRKAEIVSLEIQRSKTEPTKEPWIEFAGVFQDDPDFADIDASIRAE